MIKTIVHRGPDAQAVTIHDGLGLAHARLSIIDPNPISNQPMQDNETGNLIVFNGEIYNYIEVREQLISRGHQFLTRGDTEVILKAYAEWGIDCLNYFNGMWAFALYDVRQKKLFLSRDRMGVKPLVFGVTQQKEFVFASEAKAIVEVFSEFKQVNRPFLNDFIEKGFFACYEETFFKNIYHVMPGHYLLLAHGEQPKQKRYWKWVPNTDTAKLSDQESVEQFKTILTDAIKLRFRSDVPVGACLSGGMDSGTIVGLSSRLFDNQMHTFSCVYPNSPAFDESAYIRASAEAFNTLPHYIEPKHDDLIALVKQSVYEQDGPTGGASVLSQRAVMQLAGQHVKVLLDGQGADEILGGYHPYFYNKLNVLLKIACMKPRPKHVLEYFMSAKAIKARTGIQAASLKAVLIGLKQARFMNAGFQTLVPETNQLSYMKPFKGDELNTLLLEHTFTNLTDLLHYEDRNSMAFSVESRLPFLDYRLIEYVFSLGHHYKIRGSTNKWLLYQVARDVLPQKVLHRKDKMGFSTPFYKWLTEGESMGYLEQLFSKQQVLYHGLTQQFQAYLYKQFQALKANESADFNAIWRLFSANIWLDALF